jgi:hypothetical protein
MGQLTRYQVTMMRAEQEKKDKYIDGIVSSHGVELATLTVTVVAGDEINALTVAEAWTLRYCTDPEDSPTGSGLWKFAETPIRQSWNQRNLADEGECM